MGLPDSESLPTGFDGLMRYNYSRDLVRTVNHQGAVRLQGSEKWRHNQAARYTVKMKRTCDFEKFTFQLNFVKIALPAKIVSSNSGVCVCASVRRGWFPHTTTQLWDTNWVFYILTQFRHYLPGDSIRLHRLRAPSYKWVSRHPYFRFQLEIQAVSWASDWWAVDWKFPPPPPWVWLIC